MTNTDTHSFTVRTWSDTRSNRRDRTYKVQASHAQDAICEARWLAESAVRQAITVCCEITDVDGKGAPVDCEHSEARKYQGFVLRFDGGRDCKACALELGATSQAPKAVDLMAALEASLGIDR